MNKVNLRKEFFRIGLSDIRRVVDGLEQGKDFLGVKWTEKAKAQQYFDTLDIEHDPDKKGQWLKRARLLGERRQREPLRVSLQEEGEEDGSGPTEATTELIVPTSSGADLTTGAIVAAADPPV